MARPRMALALLLATMLALADGLHHARVDRREQLQPGNAPHIIVVMADDLGWSGVGFNMQPEQAMLPASSWVQTPTLDTLAKNGIVLKRHYAAKTCAPSRSSFLSGRYPFHVNQMNPKIEQPFMGVPLGMSTIADILSDVGYETYHVGKWHLGMHSEELLPQRRGFKSSLAMLGGSMDYFKLQTGVGDYTFQANDLWLNDNPAKDTLERANTDPSKCVIYSERNAGTKEQCRPYATDIFMDFAVEKIRSHDITKPMFMYLALQNVHGPSQVPLRFLDAYGTDQFRANSYRRYGFAMITALDEAMRNLQTALVAKSMWEDTLLVFMSDNGGKHKEAQNFPLRGGKGGVFEGGVRVASFVAGGFLPDAMRGRTLDGLMHVCDWWATFAGLAGISEAKNPGFLDPRSKDTASIPHGVKQVDSLDMWPYLSGEVQHSPRKVVHLSLNPDKGGKGALIVGRWKLVVGSFGSFYPTPTSPDGSSVGMLQRANQSDTELIQHDCGEGCLFDLKEDEGEQNDLQSSERHGGLRKNLQALYRSSAESHFQSYFVNAHDRPNVKARAKENNGFWGPWHRNLPPRSMTDRRLVGRKIKFDGVAIQARQDAQACYADCDENDACRGWQFKPTVKCSETPAGTTVCSLTSSGDCVLFDRLWRKSKDGTVKGAPNFVSGVKADYDIVIKDEKIVKPWHDLNLEGATISQDEP